MRRIAKTVLVTAVIVAPAVSAPASSAGPVEDTLRNVRIEPVRVEPQAIVDDTLRTLQIEPPPLPLPPLPDVQTPELPPPLPEVRVPEVPQPAPPVPSPVPVPVPAPSVPEPPASEGGSRPSAGATATEATRGESGEAPSSAPAPAASGDRPAAPRTGSEPRSAGPAVARSERAAGQRQPTDRPASEGERDERPAVTTVPAAARVAAPAASTPPPAADPPSMPERVAEEVADIVRALPPAILWALVAVGLIALVLAVNAFWQWRRRTALEAQRAELLDDIGVLSRALLPPVPGGLDGLAVSAAYRPADGPAAGGDFYDVFVIGERRVCVLVGDVSGHGRESVTQAALARYTLRTLLAAGHSPGEALARADALLQRDLQPNFVTVIAGIYDPVSGELTYAKAGHAPPIVLGAEHDPDGEQPAPPLALGFGETWPEFRVQLNEGVSVCLFTDGLEDARLGDARVGRAAVQRLLAAQEVPEAGRLLCDLEELANLMCDDTAAIVLSRR